VIEDAFDARRALHAPELLRAFNDAGVLAAADVHVARRLSGLAGSEDAAVALAVAFAVRAPRLGHVYVDLATIRDTATVEAEEPVDLSALPWPAPDAWTGALAASGLAAEGEEGADRPLRLIGTRLYLDRYWREERRLAADLRALAAAPAPGVDEAVLEDGLRRLFPAAAAPTLFDDPPARDPQARAAAAAVRRRFAVVAGGPGTGKTTTVARIVALLAEQSATPPLVALAARTGKAAARLAEAVHEQARTLDVAAPVRDLLLGLDASTLHRLLGWRPDSHSRFRHNRANRLPHDVVIVDETSMVSLSLMARLVEAVRPDARLVLVGDPGQLTSIEAGAVLGDIVEGARSDAIVVLDTVYRHGDAIAALAAAVRSGDADRALSLLRAGGDAVTWIDADAHEVGDALDAVRDGAVAAGRAALDAARAGDAERALAALTGFRLLCAHRRGPYGAATWMHHVERWLAAEDAAFAAAGEWYPGRPLLVTENDYGLGLFNGDTGVVVANADDRVLAAFERRGAIVELIPARLDAVETVYAMTIHKSQGSEFRTAAVLLPPAASPILTRELLYTAITRAQARVILVGTEAMVRAAIARPAARASGLRERLWG